MKVLIVGAGIAGPTLAYWLLRAGHEPTLLEQAAELRRGGYIVDFWGAGFDVAERMGIVPELLRQGYRISEIRQVGRDGKPIATLNPEAFVRSSGGRYISIARSDLAAIIFGALEGRVETILGDTVRALDDDGTRVRVNFENSGRVRDFDIVVGADGLHSKVRRLVFGPDERFEKYLGFKVAAFDIEGYRPRGELVATLYTQVGFQVTRLPIRDDVTMFLLTFLDDDNDTHALQEDQQAALLARFSNAGWETATILQQMSKAKTFYIDRVSQIRMPGWTRGRVTLVGDAAASPSLLAGQGSALAMVEAYVLGTALARTDGDHAQAFASYERRLAPFLLSKQKAAEGLAPAFAPRSRLQLFVRNTVMKLMGLPFVADLAMGKSFRDAIELPVAPGEPQHA